MTSFYDEKDLEEELSRVNCPDEDLEFAYLFEYEPPCSDVAGGGQGLSDESTPLSLSLDVCRLKVHNMCPASFIHVNEKLKQGVDLTGFLMRVVAT